MAEYQIGLVLGGGGARGIAHLGVLQALEEAQIKPQIISGVSAGAIVGAFYANGHAPLKILDIIKSKGIFEYARPQLFSGGFLKMEGLKSSLDEHLTVGYLEDLEIKTIIATTNLESGLCEFRSEGPLGSWVTASSSIPVLFEPITIEGQAYVDGGLSTNFPVKPLLDKCEQIIGVNVSPLSREGKLKSVWDIAGRVFEISINSDLQDLQKHCDLYIRPDGIEKYSLFNIKKADDIFELGYEAAQKKLEGHALLQSKS